MWRWLQRLIAKVRRFWGGQREPVVAARVARSDQEYLLLLEELLDRLVVDRSSATLMAWSIQRGVQEQELAVWLRGWAADDGWRGRLGVLRGLGKGGVGVGGGGDFGK